MDRRGRRRALHGSGPSHGCRPRMGLRPDLRHRPPRQGARRGPGQRLDGGRHEERLEADFRVRIRRRKINPKSEARNPKPIRMFKKTGNYETVWARNARRAVRRCCVSTLAFSHFGFVSNFEIRISNFRYIISMRANRRRLFAFE